MDGFDSETGEVLTTYPPAIAKAIVDVMAEVRMLGQDEKNPHGGYQYVSVDKFYDIIGRKMAAHGLTLMIDETGTDVREGAPGRDGRPINWLFARYSMVFVHESGVTSPSVRRSVALPISGPQTFGAAQSYIEKQFLRQVFKIPTGEKDADETDSTENVPASAARRTQTASQQTTPDTRLGMPAPPPPQQPIPSPQPTPPSKKEAWDRYTTFRDAVKAATLGDELDAMFASQDWQELQENLIALGEAKRIDALIKMRNDKAMSIHA